MQWLNILAEYGKICIKNYNICNEQWTYSEWARENEMERNHVLEINKIVKQKLINELLNKK